MVITVGDHKTRKKDVVEKMFRQELTAEAMKKVEKKREKEIHKSGSGEVDEGLFGGGLGSDIVR